MKMMRPQFLSSMPRMYCRLSRAPLITFISHMYCQSASGISRNGFASNAPTLLTRMSTSGYCFATAATPSTVDRSAAAGRSSAVGLSFVIRAIASSTRACVRPLTITAAPSRASVLAIAKPMPSVEPLTSAVFPLSCRSMVSLEPGDGRMQRTAPAPQRASVTFGCIGAHLDALAGDRLDGGTRAKECVLEPGRLALPERLPEERREQRGDERESRRAERLGQARVWRGDHDSEGSARASHEFRAEVTIRLRVPMYGRLDRAAKALLLRFRFLHGVRDVRRVPLVLRERLLP